MAPFKGFIALFGILALAAIACGVSVDLGSQPTPTPISQLPVEQQVSTGVAQALQALTEQAPSATPTGTPLAIDTPTAPILSQVPQLSVSVATNCRTGPGSNYGYVITISPGAVVTVVGQDPADNYWVIDVPGYPGSVCWLWGQYAVVTGSTVGLYYPATPIPPVQTLSEPRNLRASCTANYVSYDHRDGGNHDGHGGDGPPWGHPTPSPTPTSDHHKPPWGDRTPRPTRTPDEHQHPWGGQGLWVTRTPDADQGPWGKQPQSLSATPAGDHNSSEGSLGANGIHGDFATPWPALTPWYHTADPAPDAQQGNSSAQWASYDSGRRIESWTITLRWKNTDGDQTGVRVYKNGRRVATFGKNASSYTDTISRDWEHDITYGVQVFNSYAASSIVNVDVASCR
jgi:hypothetical protein